MVRKASRSAALKVSDNTRKESPRRGHRRRSVSKSDDSDEQPPVLNRAQSTNKSEKGSSGNESDTDSKKPLKKRSRSMALTEVKTGSSEDKSQSKESKNYGRQDDEEEVNEEKITKGKSKSINKSNSDTVNPATENENIQMTESPNNANDDNPQYYNEVSKNGMETSEIDVNISQSIVAEMACDNQSSDITSEQTTEVVITEHAKSAQADIDENSSGLTQVNLDKFDQEVAEEIFDKGTSQHEHKDKNYVHSSRRGSEGSKEILKESDTVSSISVAKNTSVGSSRTIKLNRIQRDPNTIAVSSVEKDGKNGENETRKKIKLRRPEGKPKSLEEATQHEDNQDTLPKDQTQHDEWSSSYALPNKDNKRENTEKSEEKPARKRITLKRSTVDDSSGIDKHSTSIERSISLQENSERGTSSSSDNIVINERRRSTGAVKSTSESDEKPQKPKKATKVVKLIRQLPKEPQEPPPPGEEPIKRCKWSNSEIVHTVINNLNFDSLRKVCPSIEFLNEEDVNLEMVIPENKSSEKVKRKTFMELEKEEMDNIEAELNAEPEDVEIKENVIAMNRKISIVDDTAGKLQPPPSPARNPISEVLFITNLVRPFTVRQLKELLERTGKIREDGFWTDRVKSKCYAYYTTAEEAESTRNALHGVHWPIGNGKKLIIDYATVEDMENAKNPPVIIPKVEKSIEKENKKPDIKEEKHEKRHVTISEREWDASKDDDRRRRRSHSKNREERERKHSRRSYTPEIHHNRKRKHEEPVPQKAMDELFLKTKATPSIFWQPLSPEEIARKQQQRQFRLELNKRRLQEIRTSGRGSIRERSGRDRNFRRR